MPKKKTHTPTRDLIESVAEGFPGLFPLPDITPIQKQINRLYMKLRLCGMPLDEVSKIINEKLYKHGITREDIMKFQNN